MIVARSFSPPSSSLLSEKNDGTDLRLRWRSRSRSPSRSPQRSANSPTRTYQQPTSAVKVRSEPVKIPARNVRHSYHQNLHVTTRSAPIAAQTKPATDRQAPKLKPRRETAHEILTATAIPARRRPKARASQRLPQGDHVADFSKLLFQDVSPAKEGILVRVNSVSPADGLFGNIDELVEGQMIVGSEGMAESTLSARSVSSDSLASLASPDDYGDGQSNSARSPPTRPTLRVSHSEECTDDHPLAELSDIENLSLSAPESTPNRQSSPTRNTSPPPRAAKKEVPRSTFKSTLTSSLKALKSAARTTILSSSGFGHPGAVGGTSLYNNESLLAHNFFDIQPSLTDDRRPPPTMTRPSPELRRYLNPQMATGPPDSPTQLHFWQDERYNYKTKTELSAKDKIRQRNKRRRSPVLKSKVDSLPSVVPLATCLPPTIRTANASSPPIWLTPEGEPIVKATSEPVPHDPDTALVAPNGISKNREPRENRDFLRMYVCEMAMRRSGKLNDDVSLGRAKLWLPPMSTGTNTISTTEPRKSGADRWTVLNIDEV